MQVFAIAAEENTVREFGFVQPTASATLQFSFFEITTAQAAGNSPFFRGVIANWTSKAQTHTLFAGPIGTIYYTDRVRM
jgi:hypothetical protein